MLKHASSILSLSFLQQEAKDGHLAGIPPISLRFSEFSLHKNNLKDRFFLDKNI
jgi:hypothetical protein